MKSFKITLLTIVAALLAWPAAAQTPIDIQSQHRTSIGYEVDDSNPPELNALLTISRWESGTRDEMDQYDFDDQSWEYTLNNINANTVRSQCGATTCTVTLVGRRADGTELDRQEYEAVLSGMGTNQLIVKIDGTSATPAPNAFVQGLDDDAPLVDGARILDQEVFLGGMGVVEKTMPADFARAGVEYQWDGDFVRDDQVYIAKQFN